MTIKLKVTPAQFQVIYEFLYNTKLGNRNVFEDAISELMNDLEEDGVMHLLKGYEAVNGVPHIRVHFDEYGPTYEILSRDSIEGYTPGS